MTNLITWSFAILVAVALLLYYTVPKRFGWVVILLTNCVFYAFSGIQNFAFLITAALASFFGALVTSHLNDIARANKEKRQSVTALKRVTLIAFLTIVIGILLYLKHYLPIRCSLLLPLGISFYTFSAITYFMDVYNKKIAVEKNFFRYFSYVSFFPALITGPINRYNELGKQLHEDHPFEFDNIKHGILLFLFGAMKKYAIADLMSDRMSPILDQGYTNLPGGLALIGVLIYAVWQYADFSGGVDMVLGVAMLFGIRLPQNFRQPYFSISLADFWRRWHITLGAFMRDYVFYPLALTKVMQRITKLIAGNPSNNKSLARATSPAGKAQDNKSGDNKHSNTFNIRKHLARSITGGFCNIVVFFFVGIWHGRELHFVIWGLYNGVIIALSDALKPLFDAINSALHIPVKSLAWKVFRIIRTFIIVCLGWYFDRIVDVKMALLYIKRLFTDFGNPADFLSTQYLKSIFDSFRDVESQLVLITLSLIVLIVASVKRERGYDLWDSVKKKNIAVRYAAYYIPLLLVILSFSFSPGNPVFMYAQY